MIKAMRLSELQNKVSGAQLIGEDVAFEGISTDSRTVKANELFVALSGECFDAHDFLNQVAQRDVKAALVEKQSDENLNQLLVEDTLYAYGCLGQLNREKFNGKVVALTGSAGKTTTKEMIACVLNEQGKVFATQGNFNNEIGVPKSLLQISGDEDFAVIEMGAGKLHDISYLMQFAQPDVGVLLNVLPAHIEGFGSIENVSTTKYEIVSSLPKNKVGIVNLDDKFSQDWLQAAEEKQQALFTFSVAGNVYKQENSVFAKNIQLENWATSFDLCWQQESVTVRLKVPGKHNVNNALAAASVGIVLGMKMSDVAAGLEKFSAVAGRMSTSQGKNGASIIDDSYNANPQAMKQAIDVLEKTQGQRVFVMGDMAELGKNSEAMHAEVGEYAQSKVDQFWAVGELSAYAATAYGDQAKHFISQQAMIEFALKNIKEDSVLLIKGSRSAQMDKVVNALQANKGQA